LATERGTDGVTFFWKKHSAAIPPGQRMTVRGRRSRYGTMRSATAS
jgi:hypothetical protein